MPRILIDLKTDCNDNIVGRIDIPADSVFALDALLAAIEYFSQSCEIPVMEILDDLKGLSK